MVKIDNLLFGYRKITVPKERLSRICARFLKNGIQTSVSADGCLFVRERDVESARRLLIDTEYEESQTLGLLGWYKRLKCKAAIFTALLVSFALALLSENTVWDIRVEGNERLPDAAVVELMSECDFAIGDFWFLKDRAEVESAVLSRCPDIAWINVNRRGSVAYVVIAEKARDTSSEENEAKGYSNVVAAVDCVIEEITVHSGVAMVNAGDAVKAGDLLIAGILPKDSGGGFCHASGSIIGRMSDTVTVSVQREYETKTKVGERLLAFDIKIFKLNANIFKRYGNLPEECDIIEDNETLVVFSDRKLPFGVTRIYERMETYGEVEYTDSRMIEIAHSRHSRALAAYLSGAELVKIKTDGNFTQSGYSVSSDIVYACEVGEEKIIFVNNLGE